MRPGYEGFVAAAAALGDWVMDTIVCPVECVGVGCDQPDFIERNGAWLLTIVLCGRDDGMEKKCEYS